MVPGINSGVDCNQETVLESVFRMYNSNSQTTGFSNLKSLQPSDCSVCSIPVEVADELMGFVLCRVLIMFSNYWGVCVGEIASMMCGTVVLS